MRALVPIVLVAAGAAGVYLYERSKTEKAPSARAPAPDQIAFKLPPDFQFKPLGQPGAAPTFPANQFKPLGQPGAAPTFPANYVQGLQFTTGQTMKPSARQRAARMLERENRRRAYARAALQARRPHQ